MATHRDNQSDRAVFAFPGAAGEAATVIVVGKCGQGWQVFPGAHKTTVTMTDPHAPRLIEALRAASRQPRMTPRRDGAPILSRRGAEHLLHGLLSLTSGLPSTPCPDGEPSRPDRPLLSGRSGLPHRTCDPWPARCESDPCPGPAAVHASLGHSPGTQRWARRRPDRLLARPDTPSEGVQARCPGDHACAGRRNTARWSRRRGQQCYP
jgi:hypothetical protein